MKDFDNWNKNKKNIEKYKGPYFKEGQIWNLFLGINIGVESIGKGEHFSRPMLIVKKFNNEMFYGIPMTTQYKDNKYVYEVNEKSYIILSQMKVFSNKRLKDKVGGISRDKMSIIKEKIRDIFI